MRNSSEPMPEHRLEAESCASKATGITGSQLLQDFVERRCQDAFAELVRMYGPMVFGVCRRVVGHHYDAEDAFQATFLVLSQKAALIENGEILFGWLYQVAYNVSLRTKSEMIKRATKEKPMSDDCEPAAAVPGVWVELEPILDEELNRLSEKYRLPILLCDLGGRTQKEAATELGWSQGTLSTRLTKARSILVQRLARHGVTLSAGALAVLISQQAASATVPATLMTATLQTAGVLSVGQAVPVGVTSSKVLAPAQGILKSMLFVNVKLAAAAVAVLVAIALAVQLQRDEPLAVANAVVNMSPSAREIIDVYQKKHDQIVTILVTTSEETTLAIDQADWFQRNGTIPGVTGKTTAVSASNGRLFVRQLFPWAEVSSAVNAALSSEERALSSQPQRLAELIKYDTVRELAIAEWEKVDQDKLGHLFFYDGTRLVETRLGRTLKTAGVQREVFRVVDPEKLSGHYLPSTIFDEMLLSVDIPGLPNEREFHESNSVSWLLTEGSMLLSTETEQVNGTECLVLKSPTHGAIYLDTERALAVRKRQWLYEGELVYEMIVNELEKIGEDLWFPVDVGYTQFGHSTFDGAEYAGKALYHFSRKIDKVELNAVEHESYFTPDIKAGSWVIDERVALLNPDGTPIADGENARDVAYIQPANQDDLDSVIQAAQRLDSSSPVKLKAANGRSSSTTILIWVNAIVALSLVVFLVVRKLR